MTISSASTLTEVAVAVAGALSDAGIDAVLTGGGLCDSLFQRRLPIPRPGLHRPARGQSPQSGRRNADGWISP